ncbi:hypothetical protein ACWDLG_28465 [Nonomuraea sp. NPDC003727]
MTKTVLLTSLVAGTLTGPALVEAPAPLAIKEITIRPGDPVVGPHGSVKLVIDVVASGAEENGVTIKVEPGAPPGPVLGRKPVGGGRLPGPVSQAPVARLALVPLNVHQPAAGVLSPEEVSPAFAVPKPPVAPPPADEGGEGRVQFPRAKRPSTEGVIGGAISWPGEPPPPHPGEPWFEPSAATDSTADSTTDAAADSAADPAADAAADSTVEPAADSTADSVAADATTDAAVDPATDAAADPATDTATDSTSGSAGDLAGAPDPSSEPAPEQEPAPSAGPDGEPVDRDGRWETWRFLPTQPLNRFYPAGAWTITATATADDGTSVTAYATFNLRRETKLSSVRVSDAGPARGVRLSGSLHRVDPSGVSDFAPFARQRLEILYRQDADADWRPVGVVTTGETGRFDRRLPGRERGMWRVRYGGTDTYAAEQARTQR